MTKPTPEPIDPKQLVDLALAVVKADRFPDLATIGDDRPRLRPVSPARTDGFTDDVANLRSDHKTAEIEANPKVELCDPFERDGRPVRNLDPIAFGMAIGRELHRFFTGTRVQAPGRTSWAAAVDRVDVSVKAWSAS